MLYKYELACREAGLPEEKIAAIRRMFDNDYKRLKRENQKIEKYGYIIYSRDRTSDLDDSEKDIDNMDRSIDLESDVIHRLEIEELRKCLLQLPEDDIRFLSIVFSGEYRHDTLAAEEFGLTSMQTRSNTERINYRIESDLMRCDGRNSYRNLIQQNIGYEVLKAEGSDGERLDEIVEIMLDIVCSQKTEIRIMGEHFPAEVVKARFLQLNQFHIQYVLNSLEENRTKIRNIKQYLLTVLYNAPETISSYYNALTNYDECKKWEE